MQLNEGCLHDLYFKSSHIYIYFEIYKTKFSVFIHFKIHIYSYIDIFHFDNVGFDIDLRKSLKGVVKFEQEN